MVGHPVGRELLHVHKLRALPLELREQLRALDPLLLINLYDALLVPALELLLRVSVLLVQLVHLIGQPPLERLLLVSVLILHGLFDLLVPGHEGCALGFLFSVRTWVGAGGPEPPWNFIDQ